MNRFFNTLLWVAFAGLTLVYSADPTVSGQITNASTGLGIAGMDLDVYDQSGAVVAVTGATSGVNGLYTLTIPGPGNYYIRADASLGSGFVDQYHNHVFLRSQATPIVVEDGSDITGINFSLSIGYTISGQVTSGVTGIDGVDLDVYTAAGEYLSGCPATTSGGGFYELGALPAGNYILRAQPDPALGQFYVTTFYNNQFTPQTATPITIASANRTGININCATGGTIVGTVTALAGGAPLQSIDLDVYDALGNRMPQSAATAADGTYVMGVIPAGTYKLRVDPTIAQGYPLTYYNGVYNQADATPITVTAGQATSNINFALPEAGTISGIITAAGSGTPLLGIDLDCYDVAGKRVDVTAASAANGTYQIGPLAPGSYRLRADPALAQGYQTQYYNNKPDLLSADPIVVSGGANAANKNFALVGAGWISGLVRNAALQPLSGIDLDAYDAVSLTRVSVNAVTLADGTYQIGPLLPGQYHLRCDPTVPQGYAVEYYNSKITNAVADPITVNVGAGTPNINFTLDAGGSISGKVTNVFGGAPVQGIDIDVYRQSDLLRLDQSYKTDVNGDYIVGPLPAGTYIVRADPGSASQYSRTYYNGVRTSGLATPIVVGAGATVSGRNIALLPADGATMISNTIPAQLPANHGMPVLITVQNAGNLIWSSGAGYSLAEVTDSCGLSPGTQIALDPGITIAPGASHIFSVTLAAGGVLGSCNLQYQMIHSGILFGDTLSLTPQVVAPINNADLISHTFPLTMPPSQGIYYSLVIKNIGNTAWDPNANYALGVFGSDACGLFSQARFMPPEIILPGKSFQALAFVTPPAAPGNCAFSLKMIEELVEWFGEPLNLTINVAVPPNSVDDWTSYE